MNDLFQPELTPEKDYLADLVGEGKKFSDVQALARGKAESDSFIETLKHQMDELRQDYNRLTLEARNRESIETMLQNREAKEQVPQPERTAPPPTRPDPKDYDAYFDTRIRQHEARQREEANLNATRDLLRERFGSDYQTKLRETIDSIGLDAEEVTRLARRSPQAFAKVLGLEQTTQPFQAPPRSTNLTSPPRFAPKRTMAFYEKMKRDNPTEYHSAKTNVQMHKDAQELGASFFDAGPNVWDKDYSKYSGPNAIQHYEI